MSLQSENKKPYQTYSEHRVLKIILLFQKAYCYSSIKYIVIVNLKM